MLKSRNSACFSANTKLSGLVVIPKWNWQSNNLNWRGIAFPGALDVVNVASVMAMALAFVASVLPLEKDVLTASRSKGIDAGTLPMQTNLLFPFLPTLKLTEPWERRNYFPLRHLTS